MSTPTRPKFKGFSVKREGNGAAPVVHPYPVDPTSPTIYPGDPVKQVAGGIIRRAGAADTAILGFALESNDPGAYVDREIPVAPAVKDETGKVLIRVAVACPENTFTGCTEVAPTQANVTKTFDLVADPGDASGWVIDNNTAAANALVQIIDIVRDVNGYSRVYFKVIQSKSQFHGASGA